MAGKLMNIPNDYPQNYPIYRLQLVVEAFKTLNLMNQLSNLIIAPDDE